MSDIDIAISKAIGELERIENSSSAINLYNPSNSNVGNRLGLTEEFASEIASEIANKLEDGRRKQLLKASIISLLKSGHSIQVILSMEGITKYFSVEEIINLKKCIR